MAPLSAANAQILFLLFVHIVEIWPQVEIVSLSCAVLEFIYLHFQQGSKETVHKFLLVSLNLNMSVVGGFHLMSLDKEILELNKEGIFVQFNWMSKISLLNK